MKHSKVISLVIIASLTSVSLFGCSGEPEPPNLEGQRIFSSIKECKDNKEKNCDIAYKNASVSHLMKAPRYVTEASCIQGGHQQCVSIALAGATVWLPAMVGFMVNSRPIYLQKNDQTTVEYEDDDGNYYVRDLTADEKKERMVVAGPSYYEKGNYNHNSVVIVGGWYPTQGYYSYGFNRGGLTQGIHASNVRTGISSGGASVSRSSGGSRVSGGARTVSARGGFGGAGRGFGSGG